MVVKVHIGGSRRGAVFLMYNEDRSFMYETDNQDEVRAVREHMPGETKAYFKVKIVNGKAKILERLQSFSKKK